MAFKDGHGSWSRQMHKAVCSDCKKECEVPFKPRDDRPIYCRDCYLKRKSESR
jgi:CxxC-x17-CxxC domain-containing protein